jgi:hypothetical protein
MKIPGRRRRKTNFNHARGLFSDNAKGKPSGSAHRPSHVMSANAGHDFLSTSRHSAITHRWQTHFDTVILHRIPTLAHNFRLTKITTRPTTATPAPRYAQGLWLIMKLDLGYGKYPVPCPIQISPMTTARQPTAANPYFSSVTMPLLRPGETLRP